MGKRDGYGVLDDMALASQPGNHIEESDGAKKTKVAFEATMGNRGAATRPAQLRVTVPSNGANQDFINAFKRAFENIPNTYNREKTLLIQLIQEEPSDESLNRMFEICQRLPEQNKIEIFGIVSKKRNLDQMEAIARDLSPGAKAKLARQLIGNIQDTIPPPPCAKIGTYLAYTSAAVGCTGALTSFMANWFQAGPSCTVSGIASAGGCVGCGTPATCAATTAAVTTYMGCMIGCMALFACAQDHNMMNEIERQSQMPNRNPFISMYLRVASIRESRGPIEIEERMPSSSSEVEQARSEEPEPSSSAQVGLGDREELRRSPSESSLNTRPRTESMDR